MRRIYIYKLARLPAYDAGQILDAFQRDADESMARGITPKDRAAGRRLLRRVNKTRDKLFGSEMQQ